MLGQRLIKSGASLAEFKELVKQYGENVIKEVDKSNQTTLHLAVESGNIELVRYLISLRIYDGDSDEKKGLSFSKRSSSSTNVSTTKSIQKRILDLNAQDRNGWTPLMVACAAVNCNMVAELLKHRECNPQLSSVNGSTVLHYFVRKKPLKDQGMESYFQLIRHLVGRGCKLSACNSNGDTVLHSAASYGRVSVVLFLQRLGGVDVNATNKFGETCLHMAVRSKNARMVQTLLALGVDASINGNNGTAHDIALEISADIVDVLDRHRELVELA